MDKVRLGIIGCGGMMNLHVQVIDKAKDVKVTAACDINLKSAQRVAEGLGGDVYVTTDYRTMVDHVDAVLIALPHDLHYECGMFFARQKKHILMEKPLCNTEEECLRLIETCEEENVLLQCAYPVRWNPGFRKLKELLDSGEFGRVIKLSVWTEQLTRINNEFSWGRTARLGGGQFFSHGCHYVDIMLWLLGNPVEGAHFGTRVGTPWLLLEGSSDAIIKFENGALGYHGATWGARGTSLYYTIQVQTEKGLLEYNWRGVNKIILYDEQSLHIPGEDMVQNTKVLWEADYNWDKKQTHHEINHFTDCILNGKRPSPDGREALQSLRVIWKMYDAEKHGVVADLRGLGLENAHK